MAATRRRTTKAKPKSAAHTQRTSAQRRKSVTPSKKWSGRVTKASDALDLKSRIFTSASPARIAASLKRSAERSRRRKAGPFQSAMSMLTFYINRAGDNLPARRRKVLDQAKQELRRLFGRA